LASGKKTSTHFPNSSNEIQKYRKKKSNHDIMTIYFDAVMTFVVNCQSSAGWLIIIIAVTGEIMIMKQ
jgi:hypothetical protein